MDPAVPDGIGARNVIGTNKDGTFFPILYFFAFSARPT
jgi:hypothetical protein